MIEAQSIRPISVPRSPQQRLTIIAAVIAIHFAAITAIIVGLRPPLFFPTPSGPIHVTWVDTKMPANTDTKPPPYKFQNPTRADPQPPKIPPIIDQQDNDSPYVAPPEGPGAQSETFVVARAIAGTHTIPDYPAIETRLGHEGNVLLRLSIDQSGSVADAVVEKSSGYDGLDRAAAEWVKAHWRYLPATRGGEAVASIAEVTVTFRLTGH